MKEYLILNFFLIISLSCQNKDDFKSYEFIENEIEFYRKEIALKASYYLKKEDKKNQKELNEDLYYKMLRCYHNNKGLIQVIKKYPSERISFAYDDSLYRVNDCEGLYYKIIDTTNFFDTLYLHNIKFEYIKCFIKTSKYYDSMPDLKARIESYKD